MGSGLCRVAEDDIVAQHKVMQLKWQEMKRKNVVVEGVAEKLLAAYEAYTSAYDRFLSDQEKATWTEEEQLAAKAQVLTLCKSLAEEYEIYMHHAELCMFNPGDVVQVKDASSCLYFQAVVIGSHDDGTVDVEYQSEEEKFCSEFNVHPSRLRKVQRWDVLEVGDTVRVKVGSLRFQGVIVCIRDDDTVDIDFAHTDESGDEEEGEGASQVENHPRSAVTKLYSRRLPKQRWIKAYTSVRYGLMVATAFRESATPRA